VPEDDAHRDNIDDRSVRAFAVKARVFGAPLCGVGAWPLGASKQSRRPRRQRAALTMLHDYLTTSDRSNA